MDLLWTGSRVFDIISPASMQLTTKDDGHVTILTVDGDLVIGESESLFKKTITRLLETGKVNLLVDLRKVGFLDSSGLGALVRAMTMSQKEGGQTKLLGAGPQVKKLLEMTRLDAGRKLTRDWYPTTKLGKVIDVVVQRKGRSGELFMDDKYPTVKLARLMVEEVKEVGRAKRIGEL